MADLYDMDITATAGEAPWQNGLCEKSCCYR